MRNEAGMKKYQIGTKEGKVRRKGRKRRNILVVTRARRGKDATKEKVQECGRRETVAGLLVVGRPYTANPRQPHSITMLSRIQMTVISFGTPYT